MTAGPLRREPLAADGAPADVGLAEQRSEGVDHEPAPRQRSRAAAYLALTKPRIIELLLITTVPTMLAADRGVPSLALIAATVAGGALAAGGANAANMIYDRDIDAVMTRTRHRPLVTGEIRPASAVVFVVALEVIAFAALWAAANLLSAVLAVGAAAFYVFVYTMWLKRRSPSNIVIGGAAGAVPVLVGWAAVTGTVAPAPLLLFALIFLWTPPHFWALAVRYSRDYARAEVPMLPTVASLSATARRIVAYAVATAAVGVAAGVVAHLGWVFGAIATVLGAAFVGYALAFWRSPQGRRALHLFHFSITYLTLYFVAMAVVVVVAHP